MVYIYSVLNVSVSRKPEQLSEKLLTSLHNIWNNCCPDRKPSSPQELTVPERRASISPTFKDFREERAPTPNSDEEGPIVKVVYEVPEKEKSNGTVSVAVSVNDSKGIEEMSLYKLYVTIKQYIVYISICVYLQLNIFCLFINYKHYLR